MFFLLSSVNLLAALPDGNSEITEIPNLEGEETSFGKLTKISDEESSESKVYYKSHWTTQPALTRDYVVRKDEIYECEYFLDVPVDEIFTDRLKPGEGFKETLKVKESFKKTTKEIDQLTKKAYIEFFKNKSVEAKAPVDIVQLKAKQESGFKSGAEIIKSHITEVTEEQSVEVEIVKEYDPYKNNYDFPIFYSKNFRQRNRVYFMVSYIYNYKQHRTGSGFLGIDDNFTYTLINYTCSNFGFFLIPEGKPYFEFSEYKDTGEKIYINNELPNVIFA